MKKEALTKANVLRRKILEYECYIISIDVLLRDCIPHPAYTRYIHGKVIRKLFGKRIETKINDIPIPDRIIKSVLKTIRDCHEAECSVLKEEFEKL